MLITDWMAAAKARLLSGQMTDSEWDVVLYSLLYASEDEDRGLGDFDAAINGVDLEGLLPVHSDKS